MEKGKTNAPQAQHDPTLADHFNQGPGKIMTPEERRAYARSEESISGSKSAVCQRLDGLEMQEKYRE